MSEQAVSVRNLTKVFESGEAAVHAVNGVDLDIHGGEVAMLMGPSGSGKTTLLSMIGCILRPTSASVRIQGKEVSGLKERHLPRIRLAQIGFIFQGFNLLAGLIAGEYVEYVMHLKAFRRTEARRRAQALCG